MSEAIENLGIEKDVEVGNEPKEPSVQELLAELAKVKKAQEKAASEAAEYKKKYNATLSEKEQADMKKAELDAEREEQLTKLLRENNINKLEKGYLAMNYTPDEANKIAIAKVDGDVDTELKVMAQADARKRKEYESEWLKSRPPVNSGGGNNDEEDPFLKGFNM